MPNPETKIRIVPREEAMRPFNPRYTYTERVKNDLRYRIERQQIEAQRLEEGIPSINVLGLSIRSWNGLTRAGVLTIQGIPEVLAEGQPRPSHIGDKSIDEIMTKLAAFQEANSSNSA